MNIQKPQKVLTKDMRIVENILDEIKENDEIENIILQNYKKKILNLQI